MSTTLETLFKLGSFPSRLKPEEVGKILGFEEHDIPILVAKKLLKPLGTPVPNAQKYFAKPEVLQLAEDVEWLNTATQALYKHWQGKNASRKREKFAFVTSE